MANDLVKFPAGRMDKGVDINGPQFRSELVLGRDSYNVTNGKSQGIGVRYGMSPLPGHSDTEAPTGARSNNIAYSEGTTSPTTGFTRRTRFFKLIPVTLGDFDNLTQQNQYYAALVSKSVSGEDDDYLDIVLLSSYATSAGPLYFYERERQIYQGLHPSTWDGDTSYKLKTELLYENAYTAEKVLNYFKYNSDKPYISSTVLSVSNRKIPTRWALGRTPATDPLASTFAYVNMWEGWVDYTNPAVTTIFCGLPSQNRKNAATSERTVTMYGLNILGATGLFSYGYVFRFNLNDSPDAIQAGTAYSLTDAHYDLSETGFALNSFAGNSGVITNALVNDPESFTEAGYTAILACGDKPVACLFQDWIYQNDYKLPLWVDLTEKILFPHVTKNSTYDEIGSPKASCFKNWPDFVRGTMMVSSTTGGAAFTAANTGILEASTTYELSFSLYNKRLNFETNVGEPVKFQTGTDDNVAICLSNFAVASTTFILFGLWTTGSTQSVLDFPFLDFDLPGGGTAKASEFKKYLNYIQYRFYYRVEGTFEWLPAGSFDAPELWFRPDPELFAIICKGEVAALPGGQPGGYNDYSPLPKQDYRCVVNYKNRAWWISSTSIFFSLENNIFAYPTRNAITAQTGEFLGALVHNYPGEAEQGSRLIIFASNAIYVARFTGDKSFTAIRVSPVTVAEFPLDGSDLVVDLWTTVSAFSQRAAVVAEGILYYWGAQGIYRDDGTDTPKKISTRLDPDIFKLYDPTRTDEIFCAFNATTKEIIWFYRPRTAEDGYPTEALVYDIDSDQFLFSKYSQEIDDIYEIDIKSTDHPDLTAQRTIINIREDDETMVQRPYFYDFKNEAGDTGPLLDMVVKTVTTPSSGTRRLTLATGYDAANFATIAVGDYIALNQVSGYAPTAQAAATDMIAKISALGAGTIDILLPDDAALTAAAMTYNEYFPLYHKAASGNGLHAFPWQIETKYWIPGGINFFAIWQWLYMLFQYEEWPKDFIHNFSIDYRTPSGGPYIQDLVRFVENSDGAMQLYHALRQGFMNNNGQALKMKLAGSHIGEPWVLQYLEAHTGEEQGNVLKQYQG